MLVEVDFKGPAGQIETDELGKQSEPFPGLCDSLEDESGSLSQNLVTMSR